MNPKQKEAFNTFLKATAALLLVMVEDKSSSESGDNGDEASLDDVLGDTKPAPEPTTKTDKDAEKKKKADDKKAADEAKAKKAADDKTAADEAAKQAAEAAEKAKTEKSNPDALLADARQAAIAYAGKNGKDALREKLNKYTKGTIAEIDKAKLPELIADLKAA
jgi:hypothetical protein